MQPPTQDGGVLKKLIGQALNAGPDRCTLVSTLLKMDAFRALSKQMEPETTGSPCKRRKSCPDEDYSPRLTIKSSNKTITRPVLPSAPSPPPLSLPPAQKCAARSHSIVCCLPRKVRVDTCHVVCPKCKFKFDYGTDHESAHIPPKTSEETQTEQESSVGPDQTDDVVYKWDADPVYERWHNYHGIMHPSTPLSSSSSLESLKSNQNPGDFSSPIEQTKRREKYHLNERHSESRICLALSRWRLQTP